MTALQQKLNQLNLTTMSQHLDETLADAASKNLSAAEAFEALLDRELEARQTRSIDRASGSLACKPSTPKKNLESRLLLYAAVSAWVCLEFVAGPRSSPSNRRTWIPFKPALTG
jgi:hypothetical protein